MKTDRKRAATTHSKASKKGKSRTDVDTAEMSPPVALNNGSLKICHWSLANGSGMHAVAKTMADAERKLGLNSSLINIETDAIWEQALDADVHVSHTHIPVMYRGKAWMKQITKPFRMVGVFHGTPDHVFEGSVSAGENGAYAPSNSLMIMQHDLKRSHARVTFWERHKAIYDTMIAEGARKTDCIPLGVDREFWAAGESRGKYQGDPSVWSGENCHSIKWPLDLVFMWPWIAQEVDDAFLHLCYVPYDQHRYWFPLAHANGAYYRAHIGAWTYPHEELRRVFKSVDFVTSLVSKGDFNRLCLEAVASGAKVISYKGNPYSHYWIDEGDERNQARQMVDILRGDVEPRTDRLEVPTDTEMAEAMKDIYESIL